MRAGALSDRAFAAGVALVPGAAFYPDPAGDTELRLCFSGVLPHAIDESIRKLSSCLVGPRSVVLSA
jgi:DNA-binding transcriptional MocR family regulator